MPVSPAMAPAGEPRPPPYEIERKSVAAVEVRRGDRVVRWSARAGVGASTSPTGASISRGLLDAFVDQLVDGAANERLDGERIADTGLDRPSLHVRVDETDGGHLTLVIGARTPTATAVYGKVEETDTSLPRGPEPPHLRRSSSFPLTRGSAGIAGRTDAATIRAFGSLPARGDGQPSHRSATALPLR